MSSEEGQIVLLLSLLFLVLLQLYYANWRPVPQGTFEDRKPTPKKQRAARQEAAGVEQQEVKPQGVYRPPGSDGKLAALLRAEREQEQKLQARVVSQTPQFGLPPGAAPPSAGGNSRAARKKRAKEAQRNASDEGAAAANGGASAGPSLPAAFSPPPVAKPPSPAPAPVTPAPATAEEEKPMDAEEIKKKLRNLQKKKSAIEKLKEKERSSLNDEQRAKLRTENAVDSEMSELQKALEKLEV